MAGYLAVGGEEGERLSLGEARLDVDDGELAGDHVHDRTVLGKHSIR